MGVDTSIFNPNSNQSYDKYVFITIGKWEKRKAHDTIIHCFNKAFDNDSEVELWMVTDNAFLNDEEKQEWMRLVKSLSKRKNQSIS